MKQYLKKHLINCRGKRLKEKFLIIESDDWGAIRIPNLGVQEQLLAKGLIRSNDPFSAYDTLESEDDFKALFQVIQTHKDQYGNHPVITANTIMANPDFDKIQQTDFREYHYKTFEQTYTDYYPNQNTLKAFKEGISKGYLYPQFHAREHLNVNRWLERLQKADQNFLEAFKLHCFAINDGGKDNSRDNLMATYDYQSAEEFNFIKHSIVEGLQLFKDTFGFTSKTTIAPCYVWNEEIEKILYEQGIKVMQSSYTQQYKNALKNALQPRLRYMGQTNKLGQQYTIRNVLFEPALNEKINWVDKAMESIAVAFFWGNPAILSSHRINFVGGLNTHNRENSLEQLCELIASVLKKWPEVQFLNSAQLANHFVDV